MFIRSAIVLMLAMYVACAIGQSNSGTLPTQADYVIRITQGDSNRLPSQFHLQSYGAGGAFAVNGPNGWNGRGKYDAGGGSFWWRYPDGRDGTADFTLDKSEMMTGTAEGNGFRVAFTAQPAGTGPSAVEAPNVPAPSSSSAIASGPADSCLARAQKCAPCANGKMQIAGETECIYVTMNICMLAACTDGSATPGYARRQAYNDRALVVDGSLTQAQVNELMTTCRALPHGLLMPVPGLPEMPGSVRERQCQAFKKTVDACQFVLIGSHGDGEKFRACLRDGYDGPR